MTEVVSGDSVLMQKYSLLSSLEQAFLQLTALTYRYGNLRSYEIYAYPKMLIVLSQIDPKANLNINKIKKLHNSLINAGFINKAGNCLESILHPISSLAVTSSNPYYTKNVTYMNKLHEGYNSLDNLLFYTWGENREFDNLRKLHFALYTNNTKCLERLSFEEQEIVLNLYGTMFANYLPDIQWLKSRDAVFQALLCCSNIRLFYSAMLIQNAMLYKFDFWFNFYKEQNYFLDLEENIYAVDQHFLHLDLSQGKIDQAKVRASILGLDYAVSVFTATNYFLIKDYKQACKYYELAFKEYTHNFANVNWIEFANFVILYTLSLILTKNTKKVFPQIISKLENHPYLAALKYLIMALIILGNGDIETSNKYITDIMLQVISKNLMSPIITTLIDLIEYLKGDNKKLDITNLKEKFSLYKKYEHVLPTHILAQLIIALSPSDSTEYQEYINQSIYQEIDFTKIIELKAQWEYIIDKLEGAIKPFNQSSTTRPNEKRLVWLLDIKKLRIEIQEQAKLKSGKWGTAKELTFNKLSNYLLKDDEALSEHDKKVLKESLVKDSYSRIGYSLLTEKVIINLVGNPNVYSMDNKDIPLELVKGDLQLNVIKTKEGGYNLTLSHFSDEPTIILEKETLNRYKVIDFAESAVALATIVGKKGITLPQESKDKLIDIICKSGSGLKINADIDEENLPVVNANETCFLHLFPYEGGLKVSLLVYPFNQAGSYFYPGSGQANLIVALESGQKQRMLRNLKSEVKLAKHVIENCELLANFNDNSYEWIFLEVESCLSLLEQVQNYQVSHPSCLEVEWPKGQSLKLKQSIATNQLSLKVKSNRDWFEYEGEVTLEDNRVLNIKTLMSLLESSTSGRFIKLDDGSFLALNESFKRQLEELKSASEGNKIHKLASNILFPIAENAKESNLDKGWKDHINKIKNMQKHAPQVPTTLQAELRDYQKEGFTYLSRLANWEIGACLADDMGLGKTVQTIALMLEQAKNGPTLIISPTSLCFNWLDELNRFAPNLNVYTPYGENDRTTQITNLDKMDVLICSYTLMQQMEELLIQKEWNLIVFDEAQAIKNHYTKRWKVASELKSKCRVALTGTPIENHLGELWSIFRVLNPGLLGSIASFQERFLTPISNHTDLNAKRALKEMIQPYILRRTKSQVLSELPPKTEKCLFIEQSPDEKAFYAVVRQRAMERIEKLSDGTNKRFNILSEITRLRQACCHSTLVDENINIENSKLKVFVELVDELISNNHQALVFSQYVGYLTKVQEVLKQNNISYQYIDGSTPINKRKEAVNEFQLGNGDVFLISLKAGGTGLNLTRADYVIILDPWWNPSVEDQASARAHRMGQERPVTVYRLITKDTIEEKIIKLHQDKRNLAEDLLSGQDVGGKMSDDELANLIYQI